MKWSKEVIFQFLDAYRMHPCIWNPNHHEHKNRGSVALAWQSIHNSLKFNCSVYELKKKRDSLMASFRMLINKKKKCINANPGADVMFEPHWFAYEKMEKFLGPIYLCRATETETPSIEEPDMYDEEVTCFKIEDLSNDDTFNYESNEEMTDNISPQLLSFSSKNIKPANEAEECLEETYHLPKPASKVKRKTSNEEMDECDLYAQLLAKKLRRFSEHQQEEIMFEIDGLIIQKRKTLARQALRSSSVSEGFHSPRSTTTTSEYSSMEGRS